MRGGNGPHAKLGEVASHDPESETETPTEDFGGNVGLEDHRDGELEVTVLIVFGIVEHLLGANKRPAGRGRGDLLPESIVRHDWSSREGVKSRRDERDGSDDVLGLIRDKEMFSRLRAEC